MSVTTVNKLKESIVFTSLSFIFAKKPIMFANKNTRPVVYLLGPKRRFFMFITTLFYTLKNLLADLLGDVGNRLGYKAELSGGTERDEDNEDEGVKGRHKRLALHLPVGGETEVEVETHARNDVAVDDIEHEVGLKEVVEEYDGKNEDDVLCVHGDIVFYTWKKMLPIHLILAVDENYGIGKNGGIPWDSDLGYFKKITTTTQYSHKRNAIIMGRMTYVSMPIFRISMSRKCVVVTSTTPILPYATTSRTLSDAITMCRDDPTIENIFIIGGAMMYKEALDIGIVEKIYLTRVLSTYDCDVCVPWLKNILSRYYKMSSIRQAGRFTYEVYSQNGETEYINLLKDIVKNGESRPNRTGVDTSSVFGRSIRFPFKDGFPLLTTKRVFWKGVIEELLWFLRGDTSSARLSEKGVRIWEGNTSEEYLEKRGLGKYNQGDCGPVYGYQWRHWNAAYGSCDDSYEGCGIDQIAQVIDSIKNDPYSRRHIISAWNVGQLDEMVLPPCHVLCQFFVSKNGELSCQMYQRSADMFLGVPFNIASYAALTYIIARETGLEPKELIMCFGDAHIYSNHMDAVEEQLQREQRKFPTLRISNDAGSYDTLKMDDFIIEGYDPHGTIKAPMAV